MIYCFCICFVFLMKFIQELLRDNMVTFTLEFQFSIQKLTRSHLDYGTTCILYIAVNLLMRHHRLQYKQIHFTLIS